MFSALFQSLYLKIAGIFLFLFILTGGVYIYFTLFMSEMYVQEATQKISFPIAQHIVNKINPLSENHVNLETLKPIFDGATMLNPGIEIYLLNPVGMILASSVPSQKLERPVVSLDPIKKALDLEEKEFILGDDPLGNNKEKVFSVAPIKYKDLVEGYIYVILRGEEYDSTMRMIYDSHYLKLGTRAFFVTLVLAVLTALIVLRLMMGKLKRTTAVVKSFESGAYDDRIPVKSNDELDQLAKAFNSMADTIVSHMDEIKNADALRRELVANVSHDLRTPLASMQGYVETLLLKKNALTEEQQKKYLEIILNSTQRLSALVEELFTFSKLDTNQIKPKYEPFALTELVHDIVQKFQQQADQSKIRLRGVFPKDLPFVYADIGMIERVLQNLIDNALRYTPEIGVVTVELVQEGNQVRVNISDTGEGIAKEDLPHIFERFYRGQKGKARTAGGSGLGLAITKKIIESHQARISVQSTIDAGTVFSFQIPLAKSI
ncbi:MAG: HAMP domain-containing protein [SAR324 cluster bacterium]|nr:HAMP domain-containing protein [SAR324 cluster bacterium]